MQLERLAGVVWNPEIGVDFFGIDARAKFLLNGVGRGGADNRFHNVEFGLAVVEFGIQTFRDGLRERAGIVHNHQAHAMCGFVVYQKNNQQAESQAYQRHQDCSNDEALRLDAG